MAHFPPMRNVPDVVACVDTGSVAAGSFAWSFAEGLDGEPMVPGDASSLDGLIDRVAGWLLSGSTAALGFDHPTFIPSRLDQTSLNRARTGEASAWSQGAGAAVMATGIPQGHYLLRGLMGWDVEPALTVEWECFRHDDGPGLYLWEAYLAGTPNDQGQHVEDAALGVWSFQTAMRASQGDAPTHVTVDDGEVFSHIGAAAVFTGWDVRALRDGAVVTLEPWEALEQPCQVIDHRKALPD